MMNHGGLGIIEHLRATKGLRLHLPRDILRTLSIDNGSMVEGVFYPGRFEEGTIPKPHTTVDFVFSPIPFRLWPKAGRLRVRLINEKRAIAAFSSFLAAHRVSILHSELSRSSYRFATWNFVVAFDFKVLDDDFNTATTAFTPTTAALASLQTQIRQQCRELLFEEKADIRFRESVEIWPLTTLAYFYNNSRLLRKADAFNPWLYEPTSAECMNGEFVFDKKDRFASILAKVLPSQPKAHLCVYADISTTDVVLRTAVIPSRLERQFVEMTVEYERLAPPDTSRGFCAHIIEMLPPSMMVWKLANYTSVNKAHTESGGVKLLLEDTDETAVTAGSLSPGFTHLLAEIKSSQFRVDGGKTFDISPSAKVLSIRHLLKGLAIDRAHNLRAVAKYDIFLSYSEMDSQTAERLQKQMKHNDLVCFMAKKELKEEGGIDFSERIRKAIIDSREMLLLCSPSSIKSEWVTTEWAAAWALGKRITPVLYQTTVDALPQRLRILQCVDAMDFTPFIKGASRRKENWNASVNDNSEMGDEV